jgi:hypothetical protein
MIEIDETLSMALAKLEEQELLSRELAQNARASDNPATIEEYSTKSNEISSRFGFASLRKTRLCSRTRSHNSP